jgi:hypothetical protein
MLPVGQVLPLPPPLPPPPPPPLSEQVFDDASQVSEPSLHVQVTPSDDVDPRVHDVHVRLVPSENLFLEHGLQLLPP